MKNIEQKITDKITEKLKTTDINSLIEKEFGSFIEIKIDSNREYVMTLNEKEYLLDLSYKSIKKIKEVLGINLAQLFYNIYKVEENETEIITTETFLQLIAICCISEDLDKDYFIENAECTMKNILMVKSLFYKLAEEVIDEDDIKIASIQDICIPFADFEKGE